MIKKTIFLLILILISISCVSANELNDTVTSDFDDLSNQINLTDESQTLNLEKDYQLENTTQKHIVIDKEMTIDGNDYTISADTQRVFWVKADNVVIKNINFVNSQTTGLAGGVISWWGNNGTLENCNFSNNLASSAGGAVLWKGNNGSISNCNFINNTVKTDADVSLTAGEGFDSSQPHIMTVNSDGGALYLSGNNISVDYCNFIDNLANFNGGAITIKWGNNVTVSNSKFKNNRAGHSGGAIAWNGDDALLVNSKFIDNNPNDLFLNSHNATLINSSFTNESCIESWYDVNYTEVKFGPINTFDDLASLINNTPEGGILVLDDDYKFINGSNKGILISKQITIDGAGHTLDGNKLSRIFNIVAANVVLKNINFINGDAIGSYVHSSYGGGAIYWNGTDGHVENCNFTDNRRYSLEIRTEEVTAEDGSTVVVYYAVSIDDKCCEGGAIVWNGMNGTVKKCIFRENGVDYSGLGGAIYWRGACGNVINSEFYQNRAYTGAAIYWEGDNGTLTSSVLLNEYEDWRNSYEDELLYWTGDNATIKDSLLIDAIILSSNVSCDFNCWGDPIDNPNLVSKPNNTNYWILLNLTPDRTSVMEGDEVTVSLDLTNLVDRNGRFSKYDDLKCSYTTKFTANESGIVNVTLFYNQIKFEVVPFEYWDMNLLAQKINETPEGGVLVLDRNYIYVNGSNKGILISKPITIDGAGHTLDGNRLSRIFNITSDDVVLKNINFINGNAYGRYFSNDAGGGAIYWNGDNGYVENCTFIGNAGSGIEDDPFDKEETWVDENGVVWNTISLRPMGAKINEGGAIVWNGTNGTVFKCIFRNNGVGYPNYGGAICWRGDSGNVLESEFYNNDAWGGASIAWIGDNGTILSSKFINTGGIFGEDLMWFGQNGLIRYSFLISYEGTNPLYPYSGNVVDDCNYWGSILANTKIDSISSLNFCIVLNGKANKDFVNKGEDIVVSADLMLFEKENASSNFSGLYVSGNFKAKADRDGFVHFTFENGKFIVNIVPKTKIVSNDLTKYYKQSKQFKVRVYGADGKLAIGKYVKFTIGKSTYKVKTDKNGFATLKINQKPGKYVVTVQYDNVKVKNKIAVKSTLITKDFTKKVKKAGKFTVKVLNSKGKVHANQLVKIKFKGKTYKLKTNKKGIATFSVPENLKVGKYAIKIICNGLTNSNQIIIRK